MVTMVMEERLSCHSTSCFTLADTQSNEHPKDLNVHFRTIQGRPLGIFCD